MSELVSPEGGAAHNGPQLAKGPWGHTPGLSLPLVAPPLLTCRLVEPRPDIALPVLVEVAVGDNIIPLGSHDGVCGRMTNQQVAAWDMKLHTPILKVNFYERIPNHNHLKLKFSVYNKTAG